MDIDTLTNEFENLINDHLIKTNHFLGIDSIDEAYNQFSRLHWDIAFIVTGIYFIVSTSAKAIPPSLATKILKTYNRLISYVRTKLKTNIENDSTLYGYFLYLRIYEIPTKILIDDVMPTEQILDILDSVKLDTVNWADIIGPDLEREIELFANGILLSLIDQTLNYAGHLAPSLSDFVTKYSEFVKQNSTIFDKILIASYCRGLTNYYLTLEDNVKAEKIAKFGLQLSRQINYPTTILGNLLMLGNVYRHQGDLDKALSYYVQSIEVDNIGSQLLLHYPIRYIGYIWQSRGELDTALHYYNHSLTLFNVASDRMPIGRNHIMIGEIAYLQGNYQQALSNYNLGLEIFSDLNHKKNVMEVIFHLVELHLKMGTNEYIDDLLETATRIYKQVEHPIINHLFKLTHALVLKESNRRRQKSTAQQYFEKVYQENVLNFEFKIVAMKNLCDLLIDEMGDEFDQEIFTEAEKLVDEMELIGQQQQIYKIMIDAKLLKAQFDMIRGNSKHAFEQLTTAGEMCKSKGLKQLETEVTHYTEHFMEQFKKWDKMLQFNPEIRDMIIQEDVKEYIKMAIKKLQQ